MSEKHKVLILGGGITGLATAYYLEQQGIKDYLILEAQLEPGGLCRSVKKDGFTWDMTGHVLWRMDPETRVFYDTILGDNLTWVDRKAAVYMHENFVPYPVQAHLKHLPPQVAYDCLYGFLTRNHPKSDDFESWCLSNLGEGLTRHFMRPFNEKLFGVKLQDMNADWLADVPVPSVEQILRGAILGETFTMKGNAQFGYPKVGGMQALVDQLVQRLDQSKIMTGRRVESIDTDKKQVMHLDMAGNQNFVEYDHLVSTIPFRKFLKVVRPQDGSLNRFGFELKSNNVACVALGFEKPLTDLHWVYTPEPHIPFYRVGFPNNLTESVAPHGCGSVTAEITIPPNVTMSESDFVKGTLNGLKEMGLWRGEDDNPVMAMKVLYCVPAYVIYDDNQRKAAGMIKDLVKSSVYSIGRFGAWHYTSVSDNIIEAREASKSIAQSIKL